MSNQPRKGIKAKRRGTKGAFGKAKNLRKPKIAVSEELVNNINEIYSTLNQQN